MQGSEALPPSSRVKNKVFAASQGHIIRQSPRRIRRRNKEGGRGTSRCHGWGSRGTGFNRKICEPQAEVWPEPTVYICIYTISNLDHSDSVSRPELVTVRSRTSI
jgi:hypothetical protein